jgi:hypothetical protein
MNGIGFAPRFPVLMLQEDLATRKASYMVVELDDVVSVSFFFLYAQRHLHIRLQKQSSRHSFLTILLSSASSVGS